MKTIKQAALSMFSSASVFYLELFGVFAFLLSNAHSLDTNYFLVLQGLIIGVVATILIVNKNAGLLAQVVGVFFLIFFCCFPILELFTNTIYWGGNALDPWGRVVANLVITVFLIFFLIGYQFHLRLPIVINSFKFPNPLNLVQMIILLGVGICSMVIVAYLYNWNLLTFFFRGGENHEDMNVDVKSGFLLVEFFLRPLIFNIGIFIFYFARGKKVLSVLALCLGIFAVFPTGVPRFLAAAMYMPFLLHWSLSDVSCRRSALNIPKLFLPNFLIFGLFFIFPILDAFRWYSAADENSFNVLGLDTMLAGHFDGYQMLVRALGVGELTYGYGFFGALLFFVPRSIWPTKPIGSAQEVAHISNLSFDNVSMTLVGEFYLNYWYVGIVFGAFLFGIIIRSIDFEFLRRQKYEISASWIFYFQSVGLLFLVLRGSFLSAFAYSVSVALTWLTIWLISRFASIKFW